MSMTIENSGAATDTIHASLVIGLIAISMVVAVAASIYRASRRDTLATSNAW